MKNDMRIGVVNWDAGLTSDTYFGHYTLNTLGHPEHEYRLPYYAKKIDKDRYVIGERTQEEYDAELEIAADAGIDFFMYCWYPDGAVPREIGKEQHSSLAEHLPELNRMRKKYQASPVNRKIKMCAIIIALHAYAKEDIARLVEAMKQDYYEKKDGRPLLFIFGGYHPELISVLRKMAGDEGIDPYIIFMNNGRLSENGDYSEADAVSAYASDHSGDCFEDLSAATERDNDERKKFGIPVIPLLSAGWNPRPRMDRPSPWVTYAEASYPPAPTADQMEAATLDFFKWIQNNSEQANTGYGVIFAWNEFEEGGYLCPTLGSDGKPNADILEGLRRALKS